MGLNPQKIGLKEYVQSLGKVLSSLQRYVTVSADLSLDVPVHHYRPGDCVYLRTWLDEPLKRTERTFPDFSQHLRCCQA